ncbi:TIR domain-containing protein [Ktedonosporobacter rubrisoli]|uniref:TIR domain-containing protein n=1 Tax=Ktedonosporobacter rubrisoli TaxID=2509675 RepID=A0A4P6K442_KTERU|nr:toll/interleukin-1 receptor domain-containing protein [Ktedonosporobacter rubrisoli]QBD82934.1 TIR domain-containing protein [Ktedonosporobacter rubrisoli]
MLAFALNREKIMLDYEACLAQMRKRLQNAACYQEFLLAELRLQENLQSERLYGTNEQIRSDRARVLEQLNRLALEYLHISFNDLCTASAAASAYKAAEQVDQSPARAKLQTSVGTNIFISAGSESKDKRFLSELKTHLGPLVRDGKIHIWDDLAIPPGVRRQEEIRKALQSATIAILLISSEFFASDFIAKHELPYFIEQAKLECLTILCVIARHSSFLNSELADFQPVNNPTRPLQAMSQTERDMVWLQVTNVIRKQL